MAHEEQADFCKSVKEKFPHFFKKCLVVDIGSLDINGNNRYLFDGSIYIGVDLLPGKNVDLISKGHELSFPDGSIDVIISTECFEHDQFYSLTIKNIIRMIKPGGLFIFSCATLGRPEHGTRRTTSDDSPFTQEFGEWSDYYKNLEESDIKEILDIDLSFDDYAFSVNDKTHDLYFWGIKNKNRHSQLKNFTPNLSLSSLEKLNRELLELLKKQTSVMALSERDAALSERDILRKKLNNITYLLYITENSLSWKVTRPLRFVRKLLSRQFIKQVLLRIKKKIFKILKDNIETIRNKICYDTNLIAHMDIVSRRNQITKDVVTIDPLVAQFLDNPPNIDISVVTYNSNKWIKGFVESLIILNYPHSKISIYFLDNNSDDSTVEQLENYLQKLIDSGFTVNIIKSSINKGFGSGHNKAIRAGKSEYCLITNIDLVFEPDSIMQIVSVACADLPEVAAWELRQKPYEHPKFYDQVTGLTNWNSHACVLMRRSAFQKVGGYDEVIFMYGEDVELSYRLRHNGYLLRYCPKASVYHYTYAEPNQSKPLQDINSIFANLYLRLKYGNFCQIISIPFMMSMVFFFSQTFKGARFALFLKFGKLILLVPKVLCNRSNGNIFHPFRGWDYEMMREGSFIKADKLPIELPMVSVITRTYKGRDIFLRQAMLSVAHQTYQNLEHIIVQDGGNCLQETVQNIANLTRKNINFIGAKKNGRSATGNLGLSKAKGKFCIFLDDDDLLFADHLETLVNVIIRNPTATASYSFAWEIKTEYIIDDNKVVKDYKEAINIPIHVMKQSFSLELLKKENYFAIQCVLFPRKLYEERGGFDEDLEYLEDWMLWNRYAYNNNFICVEKCTAIFRTPCNNDIIQRRVNGFQQANPIVSKRIKNIFYPSSNDNIVKMLFPAGHFYSPIVDVNYIKSRTEIIWNSPNEMAGIELNIDKQFEFLKLLKPYVQTINYPIEKPEDPTIYYYNNDQYPVLDAEFLHAALCYFKPKNMIEVGSGFSSLVTAHVNRTILNNGINFICIEPYPKQFLIDGINGISKLIIEKLENVNLDLFDILNSRDILFIDSSHVSKTGSDVNYLFFEILPRLKPGVIVHIHDIFLPDEYPKKWVIDEGRNWNEQYILRAFMQNNNEWEIIWAAYFMGTRFTHEVQETFLNYPQLGGGGSFWIKKK